MQLLEFTTKDGDSINILQNIGDKYQSFGICLLDDKQGAKLGAIQSDHRTIESKLTDIFTKWLQGKYMYLWYCKFLWLHAKFHVIHVGRAPIYKCKRHVAGHALGYCSLVAKGLIVHWVEVLEFVVKFKLSWTVPLGNSHIDSRTRGQ